MPAFDPRVIEEFADKMYAQAARIAVLYTLLGIVVGAITGGAIYISAKHDSTIALAAIIVLICGIFGFLIGRDRSFSLRFQAQTALCQLQIEMNTRRNN